MSKLQILKESLVATLLILVIAWLVKLIPFFHPANLKNFGIGGDFDIYDLKYTKAKQEFNYRDTNIVIVEIGENRSEIADQLNTISSYSPKVIGVDAFFEEAKDTLSDMKIRFALAQNPNIVFAQRVILDSQSNKLEPVNIEFENDIREDQLGYANFLGNQYSVIRTYPARLPVEGKSVESFTSAIMKKFDTQSYEKLKARKNNVELIDYRGNLETYTHLTREELVEYDTSGQLENILGNKIVLLGYFVKHPPLVLEDIFFTPVNERVFGKSFPDMYGIVIHANILSMVLRGKYPTLVSDKISYVICFFIIFLFFAWMFSGVHKKGHLNHAKIFLLQPILVVVVMFIFVFIYDRFSIKVPLGYIILSIIVCPEIVWLYEKLAFLLHKKLGYKTIYGHKHVH